MIQFPSGQTPLPLLPENLGAELLRAAAHARNLPEPPAAPGDTISLQSVNAALELDLLNHLDPNAVPAAGAAEYQLAREAAASSDPATSLHYLAQAIQESPVYAAVAVRDPAFQDMRGPVQEVVDRMIPVAGTDYSAVAGTYQPPPASALGPVPASDTPMDWGQPAVPDLQHSTEAGQDPAPKSTSALPAPTVSSPRLLIPAQAEISDVAFPRPPLTPPQAGRSVAPSPQLSPPNVPLPRAMLAALDLELLRPWDTEPARATAADEYQLARAAIQTGDRPAALQHLEQSILAHPAQAATALADPAFDAIKGPVRDLITRLTLAVRERAETSIAETRTALPPAGASEMARPLQLARAYLLAAQATFQLSTYTGFVQAAFAAELALKIAKDKRSRLNLAWSEGALAPVKRAVQKAAHRLWQRLPLLAILLGWFVAGIAAGIASLPFEAGAAFRGWLLPVWALGLVTIVLFGFVRSIRSIGQQRS